MVGVFEIKYTKQKALIDSYRFLIRNLQTFGYVPRELIEGIDSLGKANGMDLKLVDKNE